ncbi:MULTISPECIES: hypothetical protein [unclassified Paenibacillus]|uniref:hypothetical protein n=1 Tax=unclassified Paenibacillus TaxID=185978 RepID=UPI001AE53EF9|nr:MULTISPECIES: hypothetical protein [unclassified Paenibacillus]MBP1157241.1 hypothetical protein [Paenibacillus sp. PvP091]MBP1172020.1 hypothetical protein [Paenibacillus sp. PvR098]MBP2438401.1 hypothetical protein [Paenibacillus sp. PvP052]
MNNLMLVCLAVWISLGISPSNSPAAAIRPPDYLTVIVMATPQSEMRTELTVQSGPLMKQLRRLTAKLQHHSVLTDTYIKLHGPGGEALYAVDDQGDWYDANRKETVQLKPAVKEKLLGYIRAAREAHYGKLVPWEEAKKTVFRKSVAQVVDLETGLRFQAQRRAGSSHADMQPLTKADTEVMKQIYNGEWSWRRRAVLVQIDGHSLAASMHGMPHGGDGIPDNAFSGHFCIHFLGSSTHGSRSVDPDHQWMVYKAAGRLDEAFRQATPYEVIDSFFIALNQQDSELLRRSFADRENPALNYFLQTMSQIKSIRKTKPFTEKDTNGQNGFELLVEVTVNALGKRPEKQSFSFVLNKASADGPWQIVSVTWTAQRLN